MEPTARNLKAKPVNSGSVDGGTGGFIVRAASQPVIVPSKSTKARAARNNRKNRSLLPTSWRYARTAIAIDATAAVVCAKAMRSSRLTQTLNWPRQKNRIRMQPQSKNEAERPTVEVFADRGALADCVVRRSCSSFAKRLDPYSDSTPSQSFPKSASGTLAGSAPRNAAGAAHPAASVSPHHGRDADFPAPDPLSAG